MSELELPAMASLTLADLRLSIRAPADGWRAELIDERSFRLFGPEQPQLDAYSPTISFMLGEPEGSGDEWFDNFTAGAVHEMETGYTNFWLARQERFELSSMVPVHAVWFEWIDEQSGLHFVQLQAFIPVDPFEMYVVNAATLKAVESDFVPVFNSILRSIRILRP
jgi:hypothetical protein